MSEDQSKKQDVTIDFNRLDKLVRIDDPRVTMLDKDEKWGAARVGHDKIKHIIDGVDAKFQVIVRGNMYVFRPLSITEEMECDVKAREDLHKLPEHCRTDLYRVLRYRMRQLAKAMTATPDSDSGLTLDQIGRIPQAIVAELYDEWFKVMQELNRNPDELTKEQIDRMIKEIEENPSLVGKLSYSHLKVMLIYVLQINMLLTDRSRSGTSQENETQEDK